MKVIPYVIIASPPRELRISSETPNRQIKKKFQIHIPRPIVSSSQTNHSIGQIKYLYYLYGREEGDQLS